MKAGLIADSQGNLSGLLTAVENLRAEGVVKIYHLGNAFADVQSLIDVRRQIIKGKKDYDDTDFLSDFSEFLIKQEGSYRASKDLDEIQWLKRNIVQVPADADPQFALPSVKNCEFDMVGGRFVVMSHNPKTLSKEDIASANIILYGNTNKYQLDLIQNRFFINPGHLSTTAINDRPPTYGLLDFGADAKYSVFDLDGNLVYEKTMVVEKRRKFKTSD